MIDLRKFIIEDCESGLERLLICTMERTRANVLKDFGKLADFEDEVVNETGLALTGDSMYCCVLDDYIEFGEQKASLNSAMPFENPMNPLLYAIIAAVFPEKSFHVWGIADITGAVVVEVMDYENSLNPEPWQCPVFERQRQYYTEEFGEKTEEEWMMYDSLGASMLMIHFDDSCDPGLVDQLMLYFENDFDEAAEGTFVADIAEHDGSYCESGLYLNGILQNCSGLADFIAENGRKRKNVSEKEKIAARLMGEQLVPESWTAAGIITKLKDIKNSRELIVL